MNARLDQMNEAIEALAAALDSLEVVDLSPTLRSHMPRGAAHPEVQIVEHARTIEEDGYRLQTLILPEHVGAHVDAPAHVQAERPDATIDTIGPTALWGRAVCVDLSEHAWQPGDLVEVDTFMQAVSRGGAAIQEGDVVLVDFGWSRYLDEGPAGAAFWGGNTPGFTELLCKELRDLGVRAVCSDTPTCDASLVDEELVTAYGHVDYFLPNDIYIIECLQNLEQLPALAYFAALPLKIKGGSGSPIRPVAFVPRR